MTRKSIPFLHRFYGTTPKNSEARYVNAWDSVELDIPELSPSEFTVGSRTDYRRVTYFRDGSHWALFDGYLGDVVPQTPLAELSPALMTELMKRIGASHFFDEGAMRLRPADIISKAPNPAYIASSQREAIVERLADYVSANFADIGGNLAIRIHEPSLALTIWKRMKSMPTYTSITMANHRPWQTNQFSAGLHFPIDRGFELMGIGQSIVTPGGDLSVEVDLPSVALYAEPSEEMSERSLIALADDIAGQRSAEQLKANPTLSTISQMAAKPTLQMTDADYVDLVEAMHAFQHKLSLSEAATLRAVEEQWNDRPLNAPKLANPSSVTSRFPQ
jgi:hypothetical protein